MNKNLQKYKEIWFRYYSTHEFGGGNVEIAAAYAAMDCMNQMKGYDQASIDDDLAYWAKKLSQK